MKRSKIVRFSCVDDLVIAGNKAVDMEELKKLFKKSSKWTTEENSSSSLGMQTSQMKNCIFLNDETYIETVIEKFSMQASLSSKTPAENSFKLVRVPEDEHLIDETLYRRLVGSPLHSNAN